MESASPKPIVFFDGVCNLCNEFVQFLIWADRRKVFQVASLQGKTAEEKLPKDVRAGLTSIVLLDSEKKVYVKSKALLLILKNLFPWASLFIAVLGFIPGPVFDRAYDLVAKHRYQIWGKKERCRIPTPEERAYFLD